jgi:hypothetical protein
MLPRNGKALSQPHDAWPVLALDAYLLRCRDKALQGSRQRLWVMRERLLALKDQLAGMDGGIRRLHDEAAFYQLGARLGMPMKIADAHEIVSVESVLNLWIAEVLAENKEPPPPESVSRKRRVMERMFAHLEAPDDLAGLNLAQLQRYKEHLLSLGGRIAYDHLGDITHLYRVADRNNKFEVIGGNPCAKITVPRKPEHNKRPPFTDDEARRLLIDAREREPIIRWGHWIGAFVGAIETEFAHARTREFYQIPGGQWVWDMTGRKLKSPFRERIYPLHDALIREGFIDYLRERDDGLLFDVDAVKACDFLLAHIRSLGIERPKCFYSWRHKLIPHLDKLLSPDQSRYLSGHAPRDVHAKHYQHHELPEEFAALVEGVKGLKDPTRKL